MSGEDDRDRSKPEGHPRADADADEAPERARLHVVPAPLAGRGDGTSEQDARDKGSSEPWPVLRPRRVKPPPAVITAGGVDMARAHASGIKPRTSTAPEPPVDEPRVVLSVETNPKRVPTHRRLAAVRVSMPEPAPNAEAADASAPKMPPPSDEIVPGSDEEVVPAESRKLPIVVRLVCVAISLTLFVGVVIRVRTHTRLPPPPPVAPQAAHVLDAPPLTVETTSHAPPAHVDEPSPPPAPTAAPPPPPPSARPHRAPKPAPSSASAAKPAFAPPFLLPGEKN